MKAKIVFLVLCLLSAYCLLSTGYCLSAVPPLINYQGVLTKSPGVPQNGEFTMQFSIHSDSTGGDLLWNETQDSVLVTRGLFSVLLGSVNAIPASIFEEPNRWLEVEVDGSLLLPRRQIVSVAYAFHSGFTDTAKYALSAPRDDDWTPDTAGFNIYRLTGGVGIGTPSPDAKLHVVGSIEIVDGNQGENKVLTSDANGLASWQNPPGLPSGVIVMWSGPIDSIPDGWALCDGTNGTPDLTDKFIKSVPNGSTDPGATGGASTHTHETGNYAFPNHIHEFATHGSRTGDGDNYCFIYDGMIYGAEGHGTSGPALVNYTKTAGGGAITGTSASASSLPPYYELAFIMKL